MNYIEQAINNIKDSKIINMKKLSINDFFVKDKTGKNIIDYLCEYANFDKCIPREYAYDLKNNKEIINYSLKENISFIINKGRLDRYIFEDTLYLEMDDGITLLEHLFIKDLIDNDIVYKCNDTLIIDLILKYNKKELIKSLNDRVLINKYKDYDCFLDYLFSTNYEHLDKIIPNIGFTKIADLCIKYNRQAEDMQEHILFSKDDNGNYYFDLLLEKGLIGESIFRRISEESHRKHMIDLFVNKKLYNNLVLFPNELISRKKLFNEMLNNYDRNKDKYLTDIDFDNLSFDLLTDVYIKCAKKDLLVFLPRLTEESLLFKEKNKTLLQVFLDKNKKLTVNKLLTKSMKRKVDIAAILLLNDVEVDDIDVPIIKELYGTELRDKYLNEKVSPEIEVKINNLIKLFKNDSKSDQNALNTLIASYRHLYNINYPFVEYELDILTEEKSRFVGYKIKNKTEISQYNMGTIYLESDITNILNHEITHMLHDVKTFFEVPLGFKEIKEKIKNDPNVISKIKDFSKRCKILKEEIKQEAQRIYEEDYKEYFTYENIQKINKSLEFYRKKSEFLLKCYDKNKVDEVLDRIYNVDIYEYIEKHKEVKTKEIEYYLEREKAFHICEISDILDAIFDGELSDKLYHDDNGEIVSVPFGHGICYFTKEYLDFLEILADYIAITKSDYSYESINTLDYILGEELTDFLDMYYEYDILEADKRMVLSLLD